VPAADAVVQKAKAPAEAEEIGLLPVDLKSATTFVTVDTILLCCSAISSEGAFAVRSHHQGVLCAASAPVLVIVACLLLFAGADEAPACCRRAARWHQRWRSWL
jgi:hypothetical protein